MIDYNKLLINPLLLLLLITTEVSATDRGQLETLGPEGCTYYEVDVQYENGKMPSGSHEMDACELSSGKMIDIVGLNNEFKALNKGKLISGGTKLSIVGATIKKEKLYVPNTYQVQMSQIQLEKKLIRNEDKLNNSAGIASTQVIKKVLVVRAIAPDASTTSTTSQLSDNIFGTDGDSYNLRSQYAACSYDELLFEPFTGDMNGENIVAGVGEVTLNSNVGGIDRNVVKQAMLDAADEKYGDLSTKVTNGELDYVMICIPPGTSGSWVAYAYVNGWVSVYNDGWCNSLSAQMHEVGHNLGLAHSGESATYDDQSGMMGYSYNQDEGPVMCFNGVKSWQLDWYPNGRETITPLQSNTEKTFFEGRLMGIAEYNLIDTTKTDKAIVQITGYGNDYYVSFNSRKGINSGTQEGGNQVLVHSRSPGQGYSPSTLVAKLSAGQEFTIEGISDTIIRVDEISTATTPSYANVYIGDNSPHTLSPISPTNTPTLPPALNPTNVPSASPTLPPTENPTESPTFLPTLNPTNAPTFPPTNEPTNTPSSISTLPPTKSPTKALNPTNVPSSDPTASPTLSPSSAPSMSVATITPTSVPTATETSVITFSPTNTGSIATFAPTNTASVPLPPTIELTNEPSVSPTLLSTESPTKAPTLLITNAPTMNPTILPTKAPTIKLTSNPTNAPTLSPLASTDVPSENPVQTVAPTPTPVLPTDSPTKSPVQRTCPRRYSGLIATSDCKGFYYCQNGSSVVKNPTMCPAGLLFNQKYQVCDWKYNVVCKSTRSSMLPPTASPIRCASENRASKECGASQSSDKPGACCPGLICNTNNKCVKEENYGCAGMNAKAKECGTTRTKAPTECCSEFVCNFDTNKCVLP